MVGKVKKRDSGGFIGGWGLYNKKGTYGIVGEDGEVVKKYGKKQLFRGKSAADNMCRELNKDPFEKYEVIKLR